MEERRIEWKETIGDVCVVMEQAIGTLEDLMKERGALGVLDVAKIGRGVVSV